MLAGRKKKSNVWLNPGGGYVCIFARESGGLEVEVVGCVCGGEAANGDQSEQRTQRA